MLCSMYIFTKDSLASLGVIMLPNKTTLQRCVVPEQTVIASGDLHSELPSPCPIRLAKYTQYVRSYDELHEQTLNRTWVDNRRPSPTAPSLSRVPKLHTPSIAFTHTETLFYCNVEHQDHFVFIVELQEQRRCLYFLFIEGALHQKFRF